MWGCWMNGLDFQEKLAGLGNHLPIVLITGHGDMSVRTTKHDAMDFSLKPFLDQDILDAIATVVQHDRQRWSSEGDLADLRSRFARLSERERQVMLLATHGKLKAH